VAKILPAFHVLRHPLPEDLRLRDTHAPSRRARSARPLRVRERLVEVLGDTPSFAVGDARKKAPQRLTRLTTSKEEPQL